MNGLVIIMIKSRKSGNLCKNSRFLIHSDELPVISFTPTFEKLKNFEFSPKGNKGSKSTQVLVKGLNNNSSLSTESSDWSPDDIQGSFDFTQPEPESNYLENQCAVTVQPGKKSSFYNIPLEVIQENSFEDLNKHSKKTVHKSQQPRRSQFEEKMHFTFRSPTKRQRSSLKVLISPYSPTKIRLSKLPTLKKLGQNAKIAKKFKDLITNKHAV
jgi:hypothetical protein